MSEISAVGSSESTSFQLDMDVEERKEEETINIIETSSDSWQTVLRMRAEESLQIATMPNLKELIRAEEIRRELDRTTLLDKRFYLYKELFSLQFQAFQENGGAVDSFISEVQKVFAKEENERDAFVNSFGKSEKELFTIYEQIVDLTREMGGEGANISEPYNFYFLQILELEETLDCHIAGPILISIEMFVLKKMLDSMKKSMESMPETKSDCERKYWEVFVNGAHKVLAFHERWKGSFLPKSLILDAVFSPQLFPYHESAVDPVEQFFPYVVKYGDVEIMRGRFDEVKQKLPEWERNYQWVELHIKAADQLVSLNPEKARNYLEKAKELIRTTLWCYPFSPNRADWNEKKDEALRQLELRGI